ncbi:(Fe-S)-binding protein [Thalassoroseus pseudoceratinae]|uniref:(Fe-S)-binding protein n=1 Tax=Thalassoroseus pseudoceratinae TaxID=2713176 RepID=UPI00141E24F5|nr:(Fe-S)-binding protein [Thalassoroseus pseudoceratinae]
MERSPNDENSRTKIDPELLSHCVHCGLCLEVCPTYQLSGDENNSPRGRLRLWREESDGRLEPDPWTTTYTAECVGCLACEPACPANVPYGHLLELIRKDHVATGRAQIPKQLRMAAWLVQRPRLFQWLNLPVRWLRRQGWIGHRLAFPGQPKTFQSTAAYAKRLMQIHQPKGPRVALLTGCLMEAVFREINFATVRVLIENNIQVFVPEEQDCCGAFAEHLGLPTPDQKRNRQVFDSKDVDAVVANSSGCGLALQKILADGVPVLDVLKFLSTQPLKHRRRPDDRTRVYVDLPCHLVHGQREAGIPEPVLDATGYQWELAPQARDCCGSGGVYNVTHPDNAHQILAEKSSFLREAPGDPRIVATSNHVCMMQWHSARKRGLVERPFQVQHVIQLLDPGPNGLP